MVESFQHYGRELRARSIFGVEFAMPTFISTYLQTGVESFSKKHNKLAEGGNE